MDKETIALNKKAINKAIREVRKAYSPDKMIIQAVQALGEEEHCINVEYERLREFYWRYNPEGLSDINNVRQLIKAILEKKERPQDTLGYDLSKEELKLLTDYAGAISEHIKVTDMLEKFIRGQTMKIMPETSRVAGPLLAAKLMALAGSFKDLAFMPASTIQLLGAEKALFRHLRSKAKSPKYGILLFHQSVQSAKNKGKAARQLANRIMIAVAKDYFGGKNELIN